MGGHNSLVNTVPGDIIHGGTLFTPTQVFTVAEKGQRVRLLRFQPSLIEVSCVRTLNFTFRLCYHHENVQLYI